jgi:hypothetical protein
MSRLDERLQQNRLPPRIGFEEAVLQVASEAADDAEAIAVLADACQSRRTTAARLAATLDRRTRLPRRSFLAGVRHSRGAAFRDVEYLRFRTVVELDGRLGHEFSADRWDDLDRDIDSALAGDTTIRVGWRQVLDPCRLAATVARLLAARGWTGALRPCGPGCTARTSRTARRTPA